jgi:LysR family hydrogen peroxide-inducible transcriptional activator
LWSEEKTRDLVRALEGASLDAAILALESELGDLEHEPLGRDPFLLALPVGHPLGRKTSPARLDQLEGESVLLLDDGHCFRDQALSVCQRAGAYEASVRATSLSTLAQMVAGGTGVTLLPKLSRATENRARSLVVRPFGPRGPSRTVALAWRKTSPLGPTLRALAGVLRGGMTRLVERDEPRDSSPQGRTR